MIKRRQFIKGGAVGTLALGALAAGASAASADEAKGGAIAVHIHGVLHGVDPTPTGATLAINTDVSGRRGDLAGAGWDSGTNNTTAGGMVPNSGPPSADLSGTAGPVSACYYTAAGSLQGDVVTLRGRSLFTNRAWRDRADSEDTEKSDTRADGRELNATANVKTGAITWSLSPLVAGGSFAGTGTVVVFNGGQVAKENN